MLNLKVKSFNFATADFSNMDIWFFDFSYFWTQPSNLKVDWNFLKVQKITWQRCTCTIFHSQLHCLQRTFCWTSTWRASNTTPSQCLTLIQTYSHLNRLTPHNYSLQPRHLSQNLRQFLFKDHPQIILARLWLRSRKTRLLNPSIIAAQTGQVMRMFSCVIPGSKLLFMTPWMGIEAALLQLLQGGLNYVYTKD